ncbi:response regulator, partial [bacterium]|nr:response regulator [bacterium]
AHDFNNLLVAMLGNLDMALADISPVSPARESIFEALAAAKHAADLTRQMLAYSGRGTHVVSRISLNELVEENAHLFRATTAKTTTLNLDLAPGLPSTEADAAQLQQVVMNLITNASEALEGRPGVITLKTGACDCDAACLAHSRLDEKPPPGRFVFVEVTDTGCGMDKETQERIFDPFFTTKITGRGLGMSAVLGIVRGHKGALTVNSAPGAGATIRVLLPLITARDAAADNAPAAARAHADAGTLSGAILLVDDEPMVRNVCAKMLERCGLSVMKAASGAEAIALVREHHGRIDAVILDLSMPQMDGMTALREMRKVEPGIKVILSSGYSEQEALEHGREAGTVGFLQKPFVLDQLRNEVQRVLKGGGA